MPRFHGHVSQSNGLATCHFSRARPAQAVRRAQHPERSRGAPALHRQCEKLIRQRDFFLRLGCHWEKELDHLDDDDSSEAIRLKGKIETINRCASDLQFALTQTRSCLPIEDWSAIQHQAAEAQAAIDQKHKTVDMLRN